MLRPHGRRDPTARARRAVPGLPAARRRRGTLRARRLRRGARCWCVMFICNHCPYVKAVEDRLIRLAREYGPRGVQLVGVCSNDAETYPDDAFDKLPRAGASRATGSRTCTTSRRTVARAFGAVCTPDIFVYDDARRLAYRGRIDDSWKDESKVTRRELAAALDALLRGRSAVREAAAFDGVLDQVAAARAHEPRAPRGEAPGWRARTPRRPGATTCARGSRPRSSARRSSTRSCARRVTSPRGPADARAAQAAQRRPGDRLSHRQAARGGRHRGGAPLRPGPDAVRGVRGPRPPRPPHLRSCGFITEFESDEIEQLQDGRQAVRLQRHPPPPRALRPVREGPRHRRRPLPRRRGRPPRALVVSRRRCAVGVFWSAVDDRWLR